jgi:hypothetical protein
MSDPDPLETRLRLHLRDLAEHADAAPVRRFLPGGPARRRGRVMTRPSRGGLVRSLAALCVVALVAVVAVRVVGRNSSTGGGDSAVLLTAAPVRVEAVLAEPAGAAPGERRLMVFDSVTRATRQVGPPAPYTYVALSPRGDVVAALAGESGDTLHLENVSTGTDRSVGLGSGTHGSAVQWSPDDTEVAVVGQHIVIVSAAGTRVADVAAPADSGPPTPETKRPTSVIGPDSSRGYQWSPDGHRFAGIVNGALIVVGTDGRTASATLQHLLPGVDRSALVAVAGWSSSDDIVLGAGGAVNPYAPTLAQGWTVKGSGELTAIPGSNLAFRSSIPARGHSATQSELDRFAAHAQVIDSHRSADGNADLYEVRAGQPSNGAAPVLIIFVRGTNEAIRLPSSTDTRHGHLVDAVLAT